MFKVGDRVKIISLDSETIAYVPEMKDEIGKTGVVTYVYEHEGSVDVDTNSELGVHWTYDIKDVSLVDLKLYHMFEIYSNPENRNRRFIDSDGDIYHYDGCTIQNENGEDLIDLVYSSGVLLEVDLEEIESKVAMTIEEIEEKLGYKIEVIDN